MKTIFVKTKTGVERYTLELFDRKTLREIAKNNNIKRGRDKQDTILNLCEANITVEVGLRY